MFIQIVTVLCLVCMAASSALAGSALSYRPVKHATFVLKVAGRVVYVDPVGGGAVFASMAEPDVILITDVHGDHFNRETIDAVKKVDTLILGPKAAIHDYGYGGVINNGATKDVLGLKITGIASYNMTKERLGFHPKGRGNGYVIEADGKRVYISGDTEDIPEMRALKGIDVAFVCMNLPYTMEVEKAASAVAAFGPKTVIPYHYRHKGGEFSDLDRFEALVKEKAPAVKVERLDWY